jgi:hypothetical protein
LKIQARQQYAATATDSYQNDDDGFLISVRRDGTGFLPEKNEPFESVANLISPQTAYNLRLSPFRMLLNWAIWLKGIFTYKSPVEKIKCTYVAQNGELTTDFLSTELRLLVISVKHHGRKSRISHLQTCWLMK